MHVTKRLAWYTIGLIFYWHSLMISAISKFLPTLSIYPEQRASASKVVTDGN